MTTNVDLNPTVAIAAIDFTFDKLEPDQALNVAEVLNLNLHYAGFANARWSFVIEDDQPAIRARHEDMPIMIDMDSLGDLIESMRADTERLFDAYNKVLGTDVVFDGIGAHLA